LGIGAGPIDDAQYTEIKSLSESPDLMAKRILDEYIIRAKIFQEQHNFRMAILESVIALEFALYSLVRGSARKKGSAKEKEERLIRRLSISKILSRLPEFVGDFPPAETILSCWEANIIRNEIMHHARLEVDQTESATALMDIELFINHYKSQIEHVL